MCYWLYLICVLCILTFASFLRLRRGYVHSGIHDRFEIGKWHVQGLCRFIETARCLAQRTGKRHDRDGQTTYMQVW